MAKKVQVKRSVCLTFVTCFALLGSVAAANAAGIEVRPVSDSNSRLEVKNAVVDGDETTILFWTWPDRGDPDFTKPCPANFYTVTLTPGLPPSQPRVMASGICTGTMLTHGAVLGDGAGRFIARDHLEEWRDGEQVSRVSFSSMEYVGTLGVNASEMGSQFVDFSPSGDLLLAVMISGSSVSGWPGVTTVIASLDPGNEKKWLLKFDDTDEAFSIEKLWAGNDGGALLHTFIVDSRSMVPEQETQLLAVSKNGEPSTIRLMELAEPFDFESIRPDSQEDLQSFYEHQENNQSESIGKVSARPLAGGGFDVLFERKSKVASRAGFFLWRLGNDGSVQSETALGSVISDHGLERWFDFYVSGNQLVLLSNYPVTQNGVESRRKTWPQTIVSWIGLGTDHVLSRLIPLDHRYLEAAMNAGDEGQQYLEAKPGSDPVMLTTLGGVPLAVGTRYYKTGSTLSLYEATDDLVAFTDARDKSLAQIEQQKNAAVKKAARQAREARFDNDIAEATGMTNEEFDDLSKQEQALVMMQDGNMDAMIAAAMQQAQAAQASMTPGQQAQMQAQMAQIQQVMQGGGAGVPGYPAPGAAPETPEQPEKSEVLTVDSLMRGHLQFRHADGEAVTLSVINRRNGDELLGKDYPNGEIDEYLNLGRYKLPLEQIGVLIRNKTGNIIEDLTPSTGQ